MRTTINLDDEVLVAAKAKVRMSRLSLGKVLSLWARRGMQSNSSARSESESELPCFKVNENASIIAADRAAELLDEDA